MEIKWCVFNLFLLFCVVIVNVIVKLILKKKIILFIKFIKWIVKIDLYDVWVLSLLSDFMGLYV